MRSLVVRLASGVASAFVLTLAACGGGTTQSGGDADAGAGAIDAASTIDADTFADAGECVSLACGEVERCFDGIDNDCDGTVDEGCGCTPGTTTRCLPSGTEPGASICSWGEMACVADGEFGTWGACQAPGGGGGTSLYDCRRIGIMGAPGANASSNFQAWLTTQGGIVTRFHTAADAPELTREELETYDLVIIDWLQRTYTTAESTILADWVRGGGGLMAMTGHDSGATAARQVSLLLEVGPNYDLPAGPLNGPATLLAHPLTVTADGTGTLPPVTFNGGLRTTVPEALAAEIVPYAVIGEDVVGVAGPLGDGRVLLFGDEWIEFDSEWSSMPAITQLWLNTVTWASPSVGQPVCEE